MERARPDGRDGGFTFMEIIVSLSLFAAVVVFILQAFIFGMSHANRANERAAATTLAKQVMEQIRASVNPYEMVGFVGLPRSELPLPDPYAGVINPTPHRFQVAVVVDPVGDDQLETYRHLSLIKVTVRVYRPSDPDGQPYVTLTTVLDDQ